MYSTLDGAKRCAKQLKSILDSSGIIFPLARCQRAVAKAGGYPDWHQLSKRISGSGDRSAPFDYWGNLIFALPEPCRNPVRVFLAEGRQIVLRSPNSWVRDVLPYVLGLEVWLRTTEPCLKPGSGVGQRTRLEIVSGALLNVDGILDVEPRLDPEKLSLQFGLALVNVLPKLSRSPSFDQAIIDLQTAGILQTVADGFTIGPPEGAELSQIMDRARHWRTDQRPSTDSLYVDPIQRAELDRQGGIEWRDAGPKVAFDETVHRGVRLQSRYSVAQEFKTLMAVVDAMPDDLRLRVASIWCDSKASAIYVVDVVPDLNRDGLAQEISNIFRVSAGGYNGLQIRHGDDERFFDPDWPEDEYPLPAEDTVT